MHSNGIIVLKDSSIPFEGGVATFKAGQRVNDPEIIAQLVAYGAEIAPFSDSDDQPVV